MSTQPYRPQDANLTVTRTLPGSATTVYSDGIDLGVGSQSYFTGDKVKLIVKAPVLTTGMLGDAATMKYKIQHDTDSAFGSAVDLYGDVLTQTGASSAGAAAADKAISLPHDVKRYIRLAITNSAAGDASSKSATLALEF